MKFVFVAILFGLFAEGQELRGRIFNGQVAMQGQLKYVAVVCTLKSYETDEGNMCGGTIIAPNWVLTAAHCLYEKVEATVFLGSIDRSDAHVQYIINPFGFYCHAQYNPVTKWNDIALIQIPKTIQCDSIAYARMPHPATNPQEGEIAIAMGWGQIGDGGVFPDRLQWTEVKIITNEECNKEFEDIIDLDLCANTSAPYGSTCDGDSGGPLVLRDTGELVGVVSAGTTRCSIGKPIIFARVPKYMTWITRVTGILF